MDKGLNFLANLKKREKVTETYILRKKGNISKALELGYIRKTQPTQDGETRYTITDKGSEYCRSQIRIKVYE